MSESINFAHASHERVTDKSLGVIMKLCANNPISGKYNVEGITAGNIVNGCKEKLDGYSWGSRIYTLIYAPAWNKDPHLLEEIGNTIENPITARSKEGKMTLAEPGCNGFIETGPDHGVFFGSIKLSGFRHDITGDGRPDTFGGNRCERGTSIIDDGSGRVEAKQDGAVIISFEYEEDKFLSKTAHYTWREATLEFDQSEYLLSDEVKLTLTDLDNVRWPFDDDIAYPVRVYSDSDKSGIMMDAYWVPNYKGIVQMNGYFPLQFTLIDNDKSEESNNPFGVGTGVLRASVGDMIYAEYYDLTLPKPHNTHDSKKITAIAKVVEHKIEKIESGIVSDPSNESKITPSDISFKKYTDDGKFLITTWWDSEYITADKKHQFFVSFSDGRTQKTIKDITYDIEITLNDDVITSKQKQHSSLGHIIEEIEYDETGITNIMISNINKNSQQSFMFNIISPFSDEVIASEIVKMSKKEQKESDVNHTTLSKVSDITIPDWLKRNASWWADAEINDNEFAKGIEYLIQEKIVDVPLQEKIISDGKEVDINIIPIWVRNNAQWWSEDHITDVEFANSIEWMITNKIIRV